MPAVVDTAAHLARLEEDGYTIIEEVLSANEVAATRAAVTRLEQELGIEVARNDFEGRRTKRVYNLLVHGPCFEVIPVHASVLPIVEGVLNSGCLISSLSSIAIHPDESPQPIHAADQLLPLAARLDRVQHDVGAHRFHRGQWGDAPRPGLASLGSQSGLRLRAPVHPRYDAPGQRLGVARQSLARRGANRSNAVRVGIAMNYCVGWIRQQENQQLGIPRDIALGFGARLRQLVGYGVYRGHIDKRDSVELLGESGELESATVWETANRTKTCGDGTA